MLKALLPRLKEPSTYAGLAGIAIVLTGWTPEQFDALAQAAAAVFAAVSVFMAETKPE